MTYVYSPRYSTNELWISACSAILVIAMALAAMTVK